MGKPGPEDFLKISLAIVEILNRSALHGLRLKPVRKTMDSMLNFSVPGRYMTGRVNFREAFTGADREGFGPPRGKPCAKLYLDLFLRHSLGLPREGSEAEKCAKGITRHFP